MSFDRTRHYIQHINGDTRSIEQDGVFYTPSGDLITKAEIAIVSEPEAAEATITEKPIPTIARKPRGPNKPKSTVGKPKKAVGKAKL